MNTKAFLQKITKHTKLYPCELDVIIVYTRFDFFSTRRIFIPNLFSLGKWRNRRFNRLLRRKPKNDSKLNHALR